MDQPIKQRTLTKTNDIYIVKTVFICVSFKISENTSES